ncbi:MAG: Uma2 family endonuclease [Planctomycetes bacterium]|nr:Uma2 family endonuclease [Planctomycetota bacterium]
MATVTPPKLLTAEEYLLLPKPDRPTELVSGEIVEMNQPGFRHGVVCGVISRMLGDFCNDHSLGRVTTNDSGILTQREPDSVRGADVAFYSYQRLPRDQTPVGYPTVSPELVFEVLSPDDRWPNVLAKVAEYLSAGVEVVVIVDPESESAHVYSASPPPTTLEKTDRLEVPNVLPGFSVAIGDLLSD